MKMHHFWGQNGPFSPIVFAKNFNIIVIYLLATFIVQDLEKILPSDSELWGCTIFGSKMAHLPQMRTFIENLLMSLAFFFHVYSHAKNQSQILIY